jgi:hypothetical protein
MQNLFYRLTISQDMAMHFQFLHIERVQRSLSLYRRDRSTHPATCFRTYPKATFMTAQLRSSVWKPQSMTYTIWDSMSISGQRTLVCVSFVRQTDSTYSRCLIVGRSDTMFPTHIYIAGAISNIAMTRETWSSTQHMYQLISMSQSHMTDRSWGSHLVRLHLNHGVSLTNHTFVNHI